MVPFSSAGKISEPGSSVVLAPKAENSSATMPPGARILRPAKSSTDRIGTLEWMMFGPWWIGPTKYMPCLA